MIASTVDGYQVRFIDSTKVRFFEESDSAVIVDYVLVGPADTSHKGECGAVDAIGFSAHQGATHWQAQREHAILGYLIDGTSQTRQGVGGLGGSEVPIDGSPDPLNHASTVQRVNYLLSIDSSQVEDLQFVIDGSLVSSNCDLSIGGNDSQDKWKIGMK
ncbi:hypothetical protein [Acidithrix ferrooxidans]|uniref:Uncharacterized protein n=1 Tax=Acidithrix ferrooxidans TaxID=1280514 RepID=A0A0D8HHU3_9ACTN|nr:hypothetical protein [Acidithrix ferrooxidans]KJF17565.1 hypothetical protein AXFE_15520 [Acidithrix ferrooxidans]